MNINKFYLVLITLLIFTASCKNVGEGMTGTKRSKSSDEFFVKKKSPLVLPPDFEEMPEPETNKIEEDEDASIEELLELSRQSNQDTSSQSTGNNSLEKLILEKIKKN